MPILSYHHSQFIFLRASWFLVVVCGDRNPSLPPFSLNISFTVWKTWFLAKVITFIFSTIRMPPLHWQLALVHLPCPLGSRALRDITTWQALPSIMTVPFPAMPSTHRQVLPPITPAALDQSYTFARLVVRASFHPREISTKVRGFRHLMHIYIYIYLEEITFRFGGGPSFFLLLEKQSTANLCFSPQPSVFTNTNLAGARLSTMSLNSSPIRSSYSGYDQARHRPRSSLTDTDRTVANNE